MVGYVGSVSPLLLSQCSLRLSLLGVACLSLLLHVVVLDLVNFFLLSWIGLAQHVCLIDVSSQRTLLSYCCSGFNYNCGLIPSHHGPLRRRRTFQLQLDQGYPSLEVIPCTDRHLTTVKAN